MRSTSTVVLPVPAAASTANVSSSDVRMRSRSTASARTLTACLAAPPDRRARRAGSSCGRRAVPRAARRRRGSRTSGTRPCAATAAGAPASTARSMISSTSTPARRCSSRTDTGCSVKPPAVVANDSRAYDTGRSRSCSATRRVDDRLQRAAAADDQPARGAVPAGLVVGDAQRAERAVHLDQIDRAANRIAAVDHDRLGHARLVVRVVDRQAEAELEVARHPLRARRRRRRRATAAGRRASA